MPQETVLLVNPSARRHRRRKNPSAKRRHRAKRRRNPVGRYFPVVPRVAMNPRRRRRRNPSRRRHHAHRRHHYRRNPIQLRGMGNIGSMFKEGFAGAAGALVVNGLVNQSPLPVTLRTGVGGYAARGLVAILLGTLSGKMGFRRLGGQMAQGAITVALTDAIRTTLQPMVPTVNLSGTGFYSPAMIATRPALPGGANMASRALLPGLPANVTPIGGAKMSRGKLGMFVAGRGR